MVSRLRQARRSRSAARRAPSLGSYVGTDQAGTGRSRQRPARDLARRPGNTVGGTTAAARNVISGNGERGHRHRPAPSNVVQGNYIGTTAAGTAAARATARRHPRRAASSNTIGGTAAGARQRHLRATRRRRARRSLGARPATRRAGEPDRHDADGWPRSRTAGGDRAIVRRLRVRREHDRRHGDAARGNVISGNGGHGVLFNAFEARHDNSIAGNLIGTDATGPRSLPNRGAGVYVERRQRTNTIGGTAARRGQHDRVQRLGDGRRIGSGGRNRIRATRSTSNARPGDRPRAGGRDAERPVRRRHGRERAPELPGHRLAREKLGGATQIVGAALERLEHRLPARLLRERRLRRERATARARRWLGFENVTTNADGRAGFDTGDLFGSEASPGDAITATATDPDGNTSEFSACETVDGGSTAGETFLVDNNTDTDDGECTTRTARCARRSANANRTAGPEPDRRSTSRAPPDDPADERAAGGDRARHDRRHDASPTTRARRSSASTPSARSRTR